MLPLLAAAIPTLVPDWVLEAEQFPVGEALGSAGDVDGDTFSDVLVGSGGAFPQVCCYSEPLGTALAFLGAADGLATEASWQGTPVHGDTFFGLDVTTAGDVNGDGFDDVAVNSVVDEEEGPWRVSLYLGSAAGLGDAPVWSASVPGDPVKLAAAGDVDGDGYDDLLVYFNGTLWLYRGGVAGLEANPAWTIEKDRPGFANDASAAGDINADGYDDILVAHYSFADPELNEGAVYVYAGSASGLGTEPAAALELNVPGALFGASVASAGDVNADGFADVIVGAIWYTNTEFYEGSAYVFLGSATGVTTTPVWTAESNLPFALFGSAVGSIGDFDGDGFDDVVVGAPNLTPSPGVTDGNDRGGSFSVYLGFAGGVAPTPAYVVTEAQIPAFLGNSVASAGDVNGDGRHDLLVGAFGYDAGWPYSGRVYLYLGAPVDDFDDDGVPDGLDACVGADSAGDADQDGTCATDANSAVLDCNDTDPAVHPGAEEICDDGLDNDCNAEIDEGCDPAPPPVDDPPDDEPVAENDDSDHDVARASMCDTAGGPTVGWAGALAGLAAATRRRRPRRV